uniref:Uncharacterized protein n=1 Tax=Panagrolaimus sp. JU765 TaxID=591449 RepID=A0AC34Q8W4_9BILA
MVLAVNLTAIFFVSVSALIAHQYNHRGAYFPILAYLWFIKYGSTSTLAHHLAIMCARSYTKHEETPEQFEFECTMIYFSIPILLVTALFHYLYYVVYENSPLFDDNESEGSEVAEI